MFRSAEDLEKRLTELKKEVTKRGFDRHALVLKDVSELSIEFHSPYVTTLASRASVQAIIAFPPQIQRGWQYIPKQALLFTPTDVIHLLASVWPDQEPQVTCLPACGLMYMKVTLVLLYGLLEIVAHGQGLPARVSMEFNTVAWHSLLPSMRQVLHVARAASNRPIDNAACSSIAQRTFEKLPIKFSNSVKIYGLLPGEQLQEMVFQPGSWKGWLHFFRGAASANTLLLLTTNYMVVIKEEFDVDQGWSLSYIPRHAITMMQNRSRGTTNELSVQLRQGTQSTDYKLTLESETMEAWRNAWIQHGGRWQDLPDGQA